MRGFGPAEQAVIHRNRHDAEGLPRVQGGCEVGQVGEGRVEMKPLGYACLASLRVVDGHILL